MYSVLNVLCNANSFPFAKVLRHQNEINDYRYATAADFWQPAEVRWIVSNCIGKFAGSFKIYFEPETKMYDVDFSTKNNKT